MKQVTLNAALWRLLVTISASAILTPIASAQTAQPSYQLTIPAQPAEKFVDSMGVNVHMESSQSPYANYPLINQRLRELGMRHIRDEMNDTNPSFVHEIDVIGKLGYTLCGLIEGGNDYPPSGRLDPGEVVPMIKNLKPTIDAVEGPNEPDGGGFVYDNVPYPRGAIGESEDLWRIVKGDPEISTLPVVVMSEASAPDFLKLAAVTPPQINYADLGNMHAYQNGGTEDRALVDWYIPYSRDLTGSDPLWTTEMGYHNYTNYLNDGEQQGVSQRASAIYLPEAFLNGFGLGVLRTFSYELIDEPQITSYPGERNYGLLNYDGSPKPAFDALKNLIAILREPEQQNFEAQSITIAFSNAPTTLRAVLLQKSTGAFYLALWNDVPVYRIATQEQPGADLYPGNVQIGLAFEQPENITVFAPNDASGVNPTKAYTLATTPNSIDLNLPPNLLLLEIHSAQQPELNAVRRERSDRRID